MMQEELINGKIIY